MNADEIAARAREIAERANQIGGDATDTQALREELERLDAELAQLDEERRKLDEEIRDRADSAEGTHDEPSDERPSWTETIVDLVSDVTERLSAIGGGWPWRSNETVERTVEVDAPVPVTIDNRVGSIKVEAGDRSAVHVTAELFAPSGHLLEAMTVTAEREGDEIVVRTDWPDARRGRRARVTVTVPPGTPVKAKTAGGSITMKDTHGSTSASTKGGSITINGANGDAEARTMGGSIHIRDHIGAVRAVTSGGSLHLSGHLTGSVDATTAGGSITVEGVERAVVNAATSGGSVRVRGRLIGDSRLRTAGGSVTVAIPSDSQVRIDGKGNSASSDFSSLHNDRGHLSGTLGDGSDGTIEFRTSGGSITLSKT